MRKASLLILLVLFAQIGLNCGRKYSKKEHSRLEQALNIVDLDQEFIIKEIEKIPSAINANTGEIYYLNATIMKVEGVDSKELTEALFLPSTLDILTESELKIMIGKNVRVWESEPQQFNGRFISYFCLLKEGNEK